MPRNNGYDRQVERKATAMGREDASTKYPCRHKHVSVDQAERCPAYAAYKPETGLY